VNNPQSLLPADPNQPVVLVAEDEVTVQNVARIVLEKAGYFVLTASDGEEALTISRRFPATIDALVSDIKMPRLDGLGLRAQIVAERPAIRVLLMSGQMDDPHVGGVAFLHKPFRPPDLRNAVRDLLGGAAPA
jgi:two-component system cell cycle sensor histidine kinase/response regulator CckA